MARPADTEFRFTSPRAVDLQNDVITIRPPIMTPTLSCGCLKFEVGSDTFTLVLDTNRLTKKDAGTYTVTV